MELDDSEEMERLINGIRFEELAGGALFSGDGTAYLGETHGAIVSMLPPADREWPDVVLEDILDADVIGDM